MRKNLQLLFWLLLVGTFNLTAQKTVPYSSSLGTKDGIDPEWTFEAEATTWYHNFWYYGGIQLYNYAAEASSAWFISPEITLEANTTYTVSFNARTYQYSTSLNDLYVYVGSGATANEMYDSGEIKFEKKDINIPNSNGEIQTFTITTTEAGNFHFAFRAENEKSYDYLYLKDFSIDKVNVVKPADITNLQVVPDAEGALSATLSWTLPTTDADGAALSVPVKSVTVSRDDVVIAELGNVETFTDTEATGLTAGTHTYSVYATLENGESTQTVSVTSDYIGTSGSAAYQVPYSSILGSSSGGIDSDWTFETEASTWGKAGFSTAGVYICNYATGPSSAWFISPAIALEANTTYTVSFDMNSYGNSPANDLYLYVGTGSTAGEISESGKILFEETDIKTSNFETQTLTLATDESGNFHFAFRVENEKAYDYFYLRNFSIDKANVVKPADITNLQVVSDAEGALSATLSWTLPTTDADGAALSVPVKSVTVSRDDVVIAELGNVETFTDTEATGLTAGTHTYSVYATLENGESTQTVSVTSDYIGTIEPETIPYEEDFSNRETFDTLWSVVDANNDNATWTYSSGQVQFGPNNTVAGDDWLLSPEINFETAGTYELSFYTKIGSRGHLKAFLVSDKDNLEGAEELMDCTQGTSSTYQAKSFEVSTPGIYRLGLHAYSEQGYSNQCSVANISLVSKASGVAATSLSNREIRYDRTASRILFDAASAGTVSVYDTTGRLVIRQSTDKGYVDAASLRQGIYIVCVNAAGGITTSKILK